MQITIGPGEALTIALTVAAAIIYIVRLESKIREQAAQRKSDVELYNVKLGTLAATIKRLENAIWPRMRGVESIVGKAHVFTDEDGDN